MKMEIQQLQYFQTLAKLEHMTRAAEVLMISQPALSKSISNIEKDLGVPLFNREGRSIYLNRFGEQFLKSVNIILDEYDKIKSEFEDITRPGYGVVSFGFIHTLGMEIVPELMADVQKKYPNMQVTLTQSTSSSLLRKLEDGAIDLCLSQKIESKQLEIETIELWQEELFVIVPTTHHLADRQEIRLDEIKDDPFISIKVGNSLRQVVDSFFDQVGIEKNSTFAGEEMHTVAGFVGAGLGVSLIPEIKGLDNYKVKKLRVSYPECKRSIGVSFVKNRYLSPSATEFKKYIMDYFKERKENEGVSN